jgi:RHS repeat-associated protein
MNPTNPHTSQTSSSWQTRYTFSGKEKDVETGYSYFGARYYDSDLSIWLSVDPLADKYPSMSAYMYVAGNPVMLVDPDGRDWFQNELTGDVYYNSDMRKGQEGTGAMTGEGWQHMGENGMFMKDKDDHANNDQNVLQNNGVFSNPTLKDDGTFNLSASIKGDKAKDFMSKQGYNFNPTQQTIYENTATSDYAGIGGKSFTILTGEVVTITEKSRYMKDSFKKDGKILMSLILYSKPNYPFIEKVGRYQITYSDNWLKNTFMTLMDLSKQMGGQHDMRRTYDFSSWSRYPGSFDLINKFKVNPNTRLK